MRFVPGWRSGWLVPGWGRLLTLLQSISFLAIPLVLYLRASIPAGPPWLLDRSGIPDAQESIFWLEKSALAWLGMLLLGEVLRASFGRGRDDNEYAAPAWDERPAWSALLLLVVILGFAVYTGRFYIQAWLSFFLENQDFTNISSALNHSARGLGLLRSGYLPGGPSGSYLAHHFAPSLLIYLPAYWLAHRWPAAMALLQPLGLDYPTHFVYAILLGLTALIGLLGWWRLAARVLRKQQLLLAFMGLFVLQPALMHLIVSAHFEVLVLPAAGFFFSALWQIKCDREAARPVGRFTQMQLWLALVLWIGVKEDIAPYLFCLGLALYLHGLGVSLRSIGRNLMIVTALYFAFSQGLGMQWAGGGVRSTWQHYWLQAPVVDPGSFWKPGWYFLLALGLLPLLRLRLFLIALAPLLLLHAWSEHLYHHNFLGHYGYALLPVAAFATLMALRRLEERLPGWPLAAGRVVPIALVALALWVNHQDRIVPLPVLQSDNSARELGDCIGDLYREIPRACVFSQAVLSPHMPLAWTALPLRVPAPNFYPPGSPRDAGAVRRHERHPYWLHCEHVLLLSSSLRPEHYEWGTGDLAAFQADATRRCMFHGHSLYVLQIK
ncbi:MAG: DUF2079 domain-containing protein [Leptospiraceae bacterium]|nr:DUF2079 domain-containing protein [Leptospiraceae bacterium]